MKSFLKSIIVNILTWESHMVIKRYTPSVIAITGSVGKTATKDAIFAMLEEHAQVRKSEKSYNSELGVPLTILGRPNAWNNPLRWIQNIIDGLLLVIFPLRYPAWLVLEVGADRPGDIRAVAAWLPIDIAVITRLPEIPVHVEYFDSPEEVMEEKASLIAGLKPSGTLVLCADDERSAALAVRAAGRRIMTYGFDSGAQVRAEAPEILLDEHGRAYGMKAQVRVDNEHAEMTVSNVFGVHAFMPLLAAIAVGKTLDIALSDIAHMVGQHYVPPSGRMHVVPGMHGSLIIDDTYNSSPAALEAALQTLAAVPAKGRKFAVLGDMMELGRFSQPEHRRLGALAAESLRAGRRSASVLMTVGIRAREIAEAALDEGFPESNILQFENAAEAGAELLRQLKPGDVALIKGSQAMRMERAVMLVMAEPARAKELLVRQEGQWARR